jgi:hypothetical protein
MGGTWAKVRDVITTERVTGRGAQSSLTLLDWCMLHAALAYTPFLHTLLETLDNH